MMNMTTWPDVVVFAICGVMFVSFMWITRPRK